MLNKYQEMRTLIVGQLNLLSQLASERNNDEKRAKISEIGAKLEKNRFLIAAFGGFSSGKSTFFNALIGDKVFPSQHTPTTASINYLSYGKREAIQVSYKDKEELEKNRQSPIKEFSLIDPKFAKSGQQETWPIAKLKTLSRENPDSVYIRDINITLPAPNLLPEGVIWIDTPGTDSVIEYHKNITYSLIEKADAILFFIFAPVPFKNSDWSFLDDIRSLRESIQTDKFFFVVNAIDSIEEQPLEEVLDFIRTTLTEKSGIENPQLIPVSSKLALYANLAINSKMSEAEQREYKRMLINYIDDLSAIDHQHSLALSRFLDLQNALSQFLSQEKAAYVLRSAAERAQAVAADLLRDIAMEKWASEQDIAEINQMIQENILPELQSKDESFVKIISSLKKNLADIKIDWSKLRLELRIFVEAQVENNKDIDGAQIEKIFRKHIYQKKGETEKEINRIVEAAHPALTELFADFHRHLFRQIQIKSDFAADGIARSANLFVKDFTQETLSTSLPSGGVDANELAIPGAIFGGLLAMLVPGGLELIGGALVGALAARSISAKNQQGMLAQAQKKVFDHLGMKRSALSSLEKQVDLLEKSFDDLIHTQCDQIIEHLLAEGKQKISAIRCELDRMEKRKKKAQESGAQLSLLMEDEELKLKEIHAALDIYGSSAKKDPIQEPING